MQSEKKIWELPVLFVIKVDETLGGEVGPDDGLGASSPS